jgi:aerobic-type carbon monoxide dehydrogenase small subunit (CoxS/CutS family)
MLGTHVACAQGVCGSCTILVNDLPIRSCLVLAAQVNGDAIRTVESLATDGALSTLQTSFRANHALQCGFCTSGILMTAQALLERTDELETEQIEEAISGHVCRCTGYEPILAAVRDAAQAWNRDPAL